VHCGAQGRAQCVVSGALGLAIVLEAAQPVQRSPSDILSGERPRNSKEPKAGPVSATLRAR